MPQSPKNATQQRPQDARNLADGVRDQMDSGKVQVKRHRRCKGRDAHDAHLRVLGRISTCPGCANTFT